ncbi:MAG: PEP-CTERM sorting domain-containing protein [Verrucomicrobiales bacterium]|jgi:hypothetical protein|nr:PEP-CTERM sorting domain-containing protein [Verrucomicrobiales bacterium]
MKIKMIGIALASLLAAAWPLSAANVNYSGPSTATDADFDTAVNWSSGTAPTINSGTENDVYYFNQAGATLTLSGSHADFSNFYVSGATTVTVNDGAQIRLSKDGIVVGGELQINGNNSTLIQNGGTISVGSFNLGWNSTSYYVMNGGLLDNTGGGRVQSGGGTSIFTQTGGTVRFVGDLNFNVDSGNPSYYNQSGGLFQANNINLALNGKRDSMGGTWQLTGSGTVNVLSTLRIGANTGDVRHSAFIQSGTTLLTVSNLQIGQGSGFMTDATSGTRPTASMGTYSISESGTAVVGNTIELGRYGATGFASISGGVITGSANVVLGGGYNSFTGVIDSGTNRYYTRSAGYVTQTGGTFAVNSKNNDLLFTLSNNGGDSAYDLSGGALTLSSTGNAYLRLGDGVYTALETGMPLWVNTSGSDYALISSGTYFAASAGRFVQSGGTVSVSAATNADLQIGYNGGKGSYELSGGELTAKRLILASGASGAGNGAVSASGSFNISGGLLTLGSAEVANYTNGIAEDPQRVVGRFVQSGGTVSISGGVQVGLHGGDGVWEMNGGELTVGGQLIVGMHGTAGQEAKGILPVSAFTVSGGTASLQQVNVGYYNENSTASVRGVFTVSGDAEVSAGAIIITNQDLTQGQVNLEGGRLSVNNLYAANNVNIAGVLFNGGTLAARQNEANFLTNFVAGAVVTGSGGGTFDNGGFAILAHAGVSGSGGLTFTGSGQTTLLGLQTYTGDTVVSGNGTLIVVSGIASEKIVVSAGATLNVSNVAGGLVLNGQELGGAGTLIGKVVFEGGSMISAGGGGLGALTLSGGMSAEAGVALHFNLGEGENSQLRLTGGTFDYIGAADGLTVNFDALSALSAGVHTFMLIDAGAAALTLGNFQLGAYDTSVYDNVMLSLNGNQLMLTFSVIPEPSTWMLLTLSASLLALAARRRR